MDPLTPTTSTLTPAISHIAETAANLSASLVEKTPKALRIIRQGSGSSDPEQPKRITQDLLQKKNERQTVRWVLNTPRRLRELISDQKLPEADADWTEVKALLEKWNGVEGVSALKKECENAIKSSKVQTAT